MSTTKEDALNCLTSTNQGQVERKVIAFVSESKIWIREDITISIYNVAVGNSFNALRPGVIILK